MASTNLSKDRSAIYFGQHWASPYRQEFFYSLSQVARLSLAAWEEIGNASNGKAEPFRTSGGKAANDG